MDTRDKILSREGVAAILEEHRRSGLTVAFANGVIDLLPVGHNAAAQNEKAKQSIKTPQSKTLKNTAHIYPPSESLPSNYDECLGRDCKLFFAP